ncbi:MAG: alpha/beta hydrolase [Ruminococcus sp.]|nr:alpha/beta hydrolase [Ruminococcus sp.]
MKTSKNTKRVLHVLLIVVLVFVMISMAVTMIFYQTAFPRSDVLSDFSLSYSDIDASLYPCRQINFSSGSNTLSGYCYTCPQPSALVVTAAGFRDSGASYLPEMTYMVDNGFDVFCYDATGVGESEGVSAVGLSQPSLDLRAALSYIANDPELCELPILLYGYSAGGYAAARCAGCDNVKAAVIISGFESPTQLMRETARSYVGIFADIEYPFMNLGNALTFGTDADNSASASIAEAKIPIAVYEGADDERVPASCRLSAYLDASDDNLTLTVSDIPGHSGHSDLWLSESAVAARESSSADPFAANEPDPVFIRSVIRFLKAAL